jgi:hypothetical protein
LTPAAASATSAAGAVEGFMNDRRAGEMSAALGEAGSKAGGGTAGSATSGVRGISLRR